MEKLPKGNKRKVKGKLNGRKEKVKLKGKKRSPN